MVSERQPSPPAVRPLGDYIAGRFHAPIGQPLVSSNPARAGARVLETAWAPERVAQACQAAAEAAPAWARLSLAERAEHLARFRAALAERAADLADAIVLETGKLRSEAAAEVQLLLVRFDLVHKLVERDLGDRTVPGRPGEKLRHHPFGVVGVIGPFNFPLHLCHAHVDPGAVHRQRRGGQAERRHAAGRPALRRGGRRRRPARRRVQHGAGRGRGGCGPCRAPGRARAVLHRLVPGRARPGPDLPGPPRGAARPGDGRQEHGDRARRRRPAPGRARAGARRLPDHRTALHRDRAGPCPPGSRRRADRSPAPPGLRAALRRSGRPQELRRPAHHRVRAGPGGRRPAGRARQRRRAGCRRAGRSVGERRALLHGPVAAPPARGAPRRRRLHRRGAVRPRPVRGDSGRRRRGDRGHARRPLRPGHQRVHRRRRALRAHLSRDPLRHRQPQPLDQPGQRAAAVRRGGPQRQLPSGRLARAAQRRLPGRGAGERARAGASCTRSSPR